MNELDRAEIRHDARDLYKMEGYEGALQALLETLVFAEELSNVILEEKFKEESK